MRHFIFTALLLHVFAVAIHAQQLYKYDNKAYKAVYLNEAVKLMNDHPGYLLLDVRSPGEYADTSGHTPLNMGHLKGALNITIDSVALHLAELKQYSGKNIFVYCSHSQRSRRISKMLADSGFTNVYNINGGMSVVNESSEEVFPAKNALLENNNPFKHIASTEAYKLMQQPATVIIDVRSKRQFDGKDEVLANNLGRITNAINIPAAEFDARFNALNIAKDKNIIIYDQYGQSTDIASKVAKQGYAHVYNLFEGLSAFMCDNHLPIAEVNKIITNPPPFKVTGTRAGIDLLIHQKNILILDARPAGEFENKSPQSYLNVGHIINAVNVSTPDALTQAVANVKQDAVILLYGSTGNTIDADALTALHNKGFKNVYFLYQGIGRFAWSSFNIENCKNGINYLTDHEGLY